MDSRLDKIDRLVHEWKGQRDRLTTDLNKVVTEIAQIDADVEKYQRIGKLLEVLAKASEQSIKSVVEPVVTEALEYVFSYGLKFQINFVERRNQTEIDFVFVNKTGDRVLGDPENTYGGGVLDVVSLTLQICLAHVLGVKGPIVLDEPTKFTDESHNPRVGSLLSALSHKFQRQIILNTHSKQLASFGDKVYTVVQGPDEISTVYEGVV